MKKLLLLLTAIVLFLGGCAAWKKTLVAKGDRNDAIMNAIADFQHTKLFRQDDVFSVRYEDINDKVFAISILGRDNRNKQYLLPDSKIGDYDVSVPTRYEIREGKLFYWDDSTRMLTQEMLDVLHSYDMLDSTYIKDEYPYHSYYSDDKQKGADYFFYRNNLKVYKRVITNIALGWYDRPKLPCEE